MVKVLNKYKDIIPEDSVYIGRPSKWGNPFVIGEDGDRENVIALYRAWVHRYPDFMEDVKTKLKGKSLVCFCSPKPCHGDVLLEIANG